MNGTHQARLVAAREIRERGRSRAFLASLVLMLIAVAGVVALPALLDTGPGTKNVGYTGDTPAGLMAALQAQGDAVETSISVHRYETLADGEAAVRDGDIDVLVVDGRQLEWPRRGDEQLKTLVTSAIQLVAVRDRAEATGIEADSVLAVMEPVPVTNVELGQVEGRSPDDETAASIMNLLLFFAISTYGAMVLSGVVEEKSSRTVEVLLARMPARSLLAGKIVGIGLLGLAQVAAMAIAAFVAMTITESIAVPAVRGSVIAWAVVWFVLGYTLYATVFGTLGSLASRTEDASSITGAVSIVLVLAFVVSFAAIGSADTTWAQVVSWFPFTAPLAMPTRIAMGTAAWWEPVLAALLTVAAIAGLIVLGGRIYIRAILHTSGPLALGDAWRGAPRTATARSHPSDVNQKGRTASQPSSRMAKTQLVLAVIAIAIGGLVFALTDDFVIGVGVGAAVFALSRQAMKLWGHKGEEQAVTTSESHREPSPR
jgi:ABC-2 type transport system permease protein